MALAVADVEDKAAGSHHAISIVAEQMLSIIVATVIGGTG